MRQILSKISLSRSWLALGLVVFAVFFNSCKDDFYELNKPSWLGESIYEQLKVGYKDGNGTNHTFNTYLRLIDDIGYKEVLRRTGSKTLFVSDDEAFDRFYKSNPWGVTSYEGMTIAQKKLIMNSSMINNAYLIELMSAIPGPADGQALRRGTAISVYDSIPFVKGSDLPANYNWDLYRDKGIYLLKDNKETPMLHFLQSQMDFRNITDEDFSVLFNGAVRQKNDAHIFGNKVIARDITCKNGYVNILQDVMITPPNMAEMIRLYPETKAFSNLMERYAAPYYDEKATNGYKLLNPEFKDSIFIKRYFSDRTLIPLALNLTTGNSEEIGPLTKDSKGKDIEGILTFDPGWNTYAPPTASTNTANIAFQMDMGAMLVPTSDALNEFFSTGAGSFLLEKYKTIDNIPNKAMADLLRNHIKPSFLSTLPHKFDEVMNDAQERMGLDKKDVVKSYVANNGAIYVVNKVFAPARYVAVTAPVSVNERMKVFDWAINNCPEKESNFSYYLLSMDSQYSLFVPWDNSGAPQGATKDGLYYLDPVSIAKPVPEMWRFWFNEATKTVNATVYSYDLSTNSLGDSLRAETNLNILNRLADVLDNHIVVGDIESGKSFYRTKGGCELKVQVNGPNSIKVQAGGNVENGLEPVVEKRYDQTGSGNGRTYAVNSMLSPSYKSVYKVLSERSEFSKFFELLQGGDEYDDYEVEKHQIPPAKYKRKYNIFYKDTKVGIDYNVKFFNTFHYTVYVPTNEAVQAAVDKGLPTWTTIKNLPSTNPKEEAIKDSLANELINFLRYHFQDNAIYIDGTDSVASYETAAYSVGDVKSYYKLHSKLTPSGLSLSSKLENLSSSSAAHVVTNTGLHNLSSREYKFDSNDVLKASSIQTSSSAVIQPIDKVLYYNDNQLGKMKQMVKLARSSAKMSKTYKK